MTNNNDGLTILKSYSTVLEKYSSTVQQLAYRGVALGEQTRRVTDWKRERRWEMAKMKDHQQ